MNNLGEVIKERRQAKNLTLRQLEATSGVSASHLARIEMGKRFPSGRILGKLAGPLGFTQIELLKLAGYMSQDDSDARIDRLKAGIKREITDTLVNLYKKIDSL